MQMEALGINFDSVLMMASYNTYMRFINEPQPLGSWLFLNKASQAYYDSVALKIRTLDKSGIESLTIDDQIKILQVRLSQHRDSLVDFSGYDYFKLSQASSFSILTKDDFEASSDGPIQ